MASPLKFILDLESKVGGAFEFADVLGRLYKGLRMLDPQLKMTTRALLGIDAALGKAGAGLRRGLSWMGRQVADFAKNTLAHFTALASWDGLKTMVASFAQLGERVINVAGEAQRTERAFKNMLGAEEGSKLLDYIDAIAKKTEFDDDPLKEFAMRLLQIGFAAEKIPHAIAMGLDVASTAKDKAEALMGVADSLRAIQQRGEIPDRMLGNLNIRGPDFKKDLAESLHTTVAELDKQLQAHKVPADAIFNQLTQSVASAAGGAVGNFGESASKGLTASFDRLKNVPDDLFKGLAQSPAAAQLAASFDRIAQAFDPSTENGKRIIGGFERMMTAFADALKGLDVDKISKSLLTLFEALPPLIERSTKAMMGFVEWLGRANVGGPSTAKAGGHASFVERGSPTANLILGGKTADDVGTKSLLDAPGPLDIGPDLSPQQRRELEAYGKKSPWGKVKSWFGMGESSADGMASGMEAGAAKVESAAAKLGDAAQVGTSDNLEIHSPSRVFRGFGQMTAEGYAQGLEAGQSRIGRSVDQAFTMDAPSMAGGGGGGGGVTVTVPITVNYEGSGGRSDADDLAARLRDLLPGQLQAALELLQVQTGMA